MSDSPREVEAQVEQVPASFGSVSTPGGMLLRVRGEEGGTAAVGAALAIGIVACGLVGDGGLGWFFAAAILGAFAVVLAGQAATSTWVELSFDELRLVRRLGPLTLRAARIELTRVEEVRLTDGFMALRVVEIVTPRHSLRILGDGHPVEDVTWLLDTLRAMVAAARPLDRPAPPAELLELRDGGT